MTEDEDLGKQKEEPKTQTEASGIPPCPPRKTALGFSSGNNRPAGKHHVPIMMSNLSAEPGRQLAALVERMLDTGEPWIEEARKMAQGFGILPDEFNKFVQVVTKHEAARRAATLADLVERQLDGEAWTDENRKLLQRYNLTQEEVDVEVRRRGGMTNV